MFKTQDNSTRQVQAGKNRRDQFLRVDLCAKIVCSPNTEGMAGEMEEGATSLLPGHISSCAPRPNLLFIQAPTCKLTSEMLYRQVQFLVEERDRSRQRQAADAPQELNERGA